MEERDLKLIQRRFKAHCNSREHTAILRKKQPQVAQSILEWLYERNEETGEFNSRGYFVRPTGAGKTVNLIDFAVGINRSEKTGDFKWDKKILVLTPTNVLVEQFAAEWGVKRYRDPKKKYAFDLPEKLVGVYDATVADKEKRQLPLNKHVVIMTYDAYINAVSEDRLNPAEFVHLFDEFHTRPRGDKTGEFIRRHVFNEETLPDGTIKHLGPAIAFALGATATHLYKSGKTIGDYLLGGDKPIHLTRINQAVQDKEICGYRNVVVETTFAPNARFDQDSTFTETERLAILKQNARDDAMVRIMRYGHDPITLKPYREMKSVVYCKDVAHAERIAKKINLAMADVTETTPEQPYAKVVFGKMGKKDIIKVITAYKKGGQGAPKTLPNADLLIHGFDDEEAEACYMPWPSGSPIEVLQMGGRVLRMHQAKPHATIFSFPDTDPDPKTRKDTPIFGELAGSYHSQVAGYEYPSTVKRNPNGEPIETPWPEEIRDLNAHYLTWQIEQFAQKRKYAQASGKKPDFMLTAAEMSRKIGISKDVLETYLYKPLQEFYNERPSRLQEVDIKETKRDGDAIALNSQRFAIGTKDYPGMGNFKAGANEVEFCLNKEAANACRFALFGLLPQPKAYYYPKDSAFRLMHEYDESFSEGKMNAIAAKIEHAYHTRQNFQRVLDIDGVDFSLNQDIIYCIDQNKPKLYFSAEGLRKLHQLAHRSTAEEAQNWWKVHPDQFSTVKTPHSLNKQEAMSELNIHPRHASYRQFDAAWTSLVTAHGKALRSTKSGAQIGEGEENFVDCAYKRNTRMPMPRTATGCWEFCIEKNSMDWLRGQIDQKIGEAGPNAGENPRRARGGQGRR